MKCDSRDIKALDCLLLLLWAVTWPEPNWEGEEAALCLSWQWPLAFVLRLIGARPYKNRTRSKLGPFFVPPNCHSRHFLAPSSCPVDAFLPCSISACKKRCRILIWPPCQSHVTFYRRSKKDGLEDYSLLESIFFPRETRAKLLPRVQGSNPHTLYSAEDYLSSLSKVGRGFTRGYQKDH